MKITILTENRARKRDILGEHGLSLLIETGNQRILFDGGQTDVLLHNSIAMGIDLRGLDAIVMSHGHYDHTGGILAVCGLNPRTPLYLGEGAFVKRYNAPEGSAEGKPISIPWNLSDLPDSTPVVICKDRFQLAEDVVISGPIHRISDELPPHSFLKETEVGVLQPDHIDDELFLALRNPSGISVVTGCSHSGIVNIIRQGLGIWKGLPLAHVVGGLHLEKASDSQLELTLNCFSENAQAKIVPLHCTGADAVCRIKETFPQRTCLLGAGDILSLGHE